jgi:hypothetical protein
MPISQLCACRANTSPDMATRSISTERRPLSSGMLMLAPSKQKLWVCGMTGVATEDNPPAQPAARNTVADIVH